MATPKNQKSDFGTLGTYFLSVCWVATHPHSTVISTSIGMIVAI
jgi:hypothetical protein